MAGNEVLYGQGGDDQLLGGGGFDALVGGPGDDLIDGGRGVYDDAGYWPSAGAVAVDLAAGTATGEGSDVLRNVEWAEGSSFDDTLHGTEGSNRLFGGPGDDVIGGRGGIDEVAYIFATGPVTVDLAAGTATGEGADTLIGIEGVLGSPFGDTINGDANPNRIEAWPGNDVVNGLDGDDLLLGQQGDDSLEGGNGTDGLNGGGGTDACTNGETVSNCEG